MKTIEYKIKIDYDYNGQKYQEYWYLNCQRHKEDSSTIQIWNDNGQKRSEEWYLNGKLHRLDGPAFQYWKDNGQKESEYWYLNGVKLSEQEFKIQSDPDYQKYLELKSKFEGAK